jgi:hypothetical protein
MSSPTSRATSTGRRRRSTSGRRRGWRVTTNELFLCAGHALEDARKHRRIRGAAERRHQPATSMVRPVVARPAGALVGGLVPQMRVGPPHRRRAELHDLGRPHRMAAFFPVGSGRDRSGPPQCAPRGVGRGEWPRERSAEGVREVDVATAVTVSSTAPRPS